MSLIFGKNIKTRHGEYSAGQPLPVEWNTRETRRQLIQQFGMDVIIEAQTVSNESLSKRLSAMEQSLIDIKDALGLKADEQAKSLDGGKGKRRGRA